MKKILVAEDESAIRGFITLNLIHSGYSVIEAESGKKTKRTLTLFSLIT